MARMRAHSRGGNGVAVGPGDEIRYDRRWFGDDAAVDFPSVVHAVERIRAAFLAGERQPAAPMSLRLSDRQALDGTVVLLDVPLRYNCRACGGRGETWALPCVLCEGTGARLSVERFRVRVPAGVRDGATFRFSLTPRHHPTTRVELRVLVGGPSEDV